MDGERRQNHCIITAQAASPYSAVRYRVVMMR